QYRQLSQRVHSPAAAGPEHRVAAVALPALQVFHPLVFEYPAGDVAVAARQMPELRRADFAAIFSGGTADRRGVSGVLECVWTSIGGAGAGLLLVYRGADRGHIHRF